MLSLVRTLVSTILILVFVNQSFCKTFESQYLGNYVSDEDYKNRDVCSTKVCIVDNDRLIYSATHDSKVHPCDDFRTFAMGEFIRHRKLNDRYQFLGFDSYVDRLHRERQRKLLSEPVEDSDPKYLIVLKTFFAKCVNPGYVDGSGVTDIFARLTEIVGSKPFSKSDWNDQNFKLSSLFNREFDHTMSLISSDEFNPHVYSSIYLKEDPYWKPDSDWQKDFEYILWKIKIPRNELEAAIVDFRNFLETKDKIIISNGFAGHKGAIEYVKHFNEGYPAEVINSTNPVIPSYSGVTSESLGKILPSFSTLDVEKLLEKLLLIFKDRTSQLPEYILKLLENLEQSNKRILANNFALSYLFVHRKSFMKHLWTKQEANESGTTRSQNRFEQCIDKLESTMRPAMQAMFARKFSVEETRKEVEQFVRDTMSEIEHITISSDLRKHRKLYYPNKFTSMEPLVMFHKDLLDTSLVEKLYEKLELIETRSLFSMIESLKNFHKQTKENEWFKDFENCCSKDEIRTFSHSNQRYLYVPVKFTLYPFFQPSRPRFFNMATLYDEVVFQLTTEIYKHYKAEDTFFPREIAHSDIFDVTSFTLNSYQSWLDAGNKDLNLSAFKLTSLQMFWLALAHRKVLKFHKNVPEKFLKQERLESKYLHYRFKNQTSFREAFSCGEMTEEENLELKEFIRKNPPFEKKNTCQIFNDGDYRCRFDVDLTFRDIPY